MKFFGRASSNYKRIKTFKKSQPLLPETLFFIIFRPSPGLDGIQLPMSMARSLNFEKRPAENSSGQSATRLPSDVTSRRPKIGRTRYTRDLEPYQKPWPFFPIYFFFGRPSKHEPL
ncbi:hypothetical protein MTP99_017387 [Tenebrio molitor]|nr:hypothetical protein MTP99_017387 [Tenebrio molitor]